VDHETPELIERQMEDTRESLTEKVSLLEQQVVEKIQSATEAVQETVQSVRSAVEDTVACVTDSVKSSVETVTEAVDMRKRVQETPWLMVGGAAAAGFITGLLVFRSQRASAATSMPAYTPMPSVAFTPPQATARRPSWLGDLFDMAGKEFKKVAEQAVATASTSLKETVSANLPQLIEKAIPNLLSRAGCSSSDSSSVHHGNGRASYADVHG
jgi:ElaB/YqjD/DUF883 family membrane-anchored ribosome-binding protein